MDNFRFKNLSEEQIEQVRFQIAVHQHSEYDVDIYLDADHVLSDFKVFRNVMRPELMTSLEFAKILHEKGSSVESNPFENKLVVDMGCGCGILGIVLLKYCNAAKVYFSDINKDAVNNTNVNLIKYNFFEKSKLFLDNLFGWWDKELHKVDYIVFNHPFFADKPIPWIPVSITMLDEGDLLNRFFDFCKNKLPEAKIIMPYFSFAEAKIDLSKTNNPQIVAKKHGFKVIDFIGQEKKVEPGLQNGKISVYEIFMQ
jgi:hypothetical protein